jgi:hypothetical protein
LRASEEAGKPEAGGQLTPTVLRSTINGVCRDSNSHCSARIGIQGRQKTSRVPFLCEAMNIVVKRKEELSDGNYILHPERARAYWANISGGRLKAYLDRRGEAFNIVIVGNSATNGDFYAIPYRILKPALVDEYRTGDKTGRVRWSMYILHHQLKVGTAPPIDVGAFYGNVAALTSPGEVNPASDADANDYAIENRKIEIEARQKQSVFRKKVMQNFDGKCSSGHNIISRRSVTHGLLSFACQ